MDIYKSYVDYNFKPNRRKYSKLINGILGRYQDEVSVAITIDDMSELDREVLLRLILQSSYSKNDYDLLRENLLFRVLVKKMVARNITKMTLLISKKLRLQESVAFCEYLRRNYFKEMPYPHYMNRDPADWGKQEKRREAQTEWISSVIEYLRFLDRLAKQRYTLIKLEEVKYRNKDVLIGSFRKKEIGSRKGVVVEVRFTPTLSKYLIQILNLSGKSNDHFISKVLIEDLKSESDLITLRNKIAVERFKTYERNSLSKDITLFTFVKGRNTIVVNFSISKKVRKDISSIKSFSFR